MSRWINLVAACVFLAFLVDLARRMPDPLFGELVRFFAVVVGAFIVVNILENSIARAVAKGIRQAREDAAEGEDSAARAASTKL